MQLVLINAGLHYVDQYTSNQLLNQYFAILTLFKDDQKKLHSSQQSCKLNCGSIRSSLSSNARTVKVRLI